VYTSLVGVYDINKLKSPTGYYAIDRPAWTYYLQICDIAKGFPIATECMRDGVPSKAYEYGKYTQTCEPMTSVETSDIKLSQLNSDDPKEGVLMTYKAFTYSGLSRIVYISFVCDMNATAGNETITYVGEKVDGVNIQYMFRMNSPRACPVPQAAMIFGIAAGSFLILLLILAVVYFTVGSMINRFYYKATQLRDIIPNGKLWCFLPDMINERRRRRETTINYSLNSPGGLASPSNELILTPTYRAMSPQLTIDLHAPRGLALITAKRLDEVSENQARSPGSAMSPSSPIMSPKSPTNLTRDQ
jgi:hypothetical protein